MFPVGDGTIEGVESWQEDYCSMLKTYYNIQQQIKDTIDVSKLQILLSTFERYSMHACHMMLPDLF